MVEKIYPVLIQKNSKIWKTHRAIQQVAASAKMPA